MFLVVTAALFVMVSSIRSQDTPTWLEDFQSWAGVNCPPCKAVFEPLFRGIYEQGFVEAGSFDKMKLSLSLAKTLYGDFARKSKIPVVLKMDKDVTVTLAKDAASGTWIANIKGLHTQPAKAGHKIYSEIMQEEAQCKEVTSLCIAKELEEVKRYYGKWKFKGEDAISHIFEDLGTVQRMTIGQDEMSKTLYSMITACSLTLTSFVFEGDRVYAKTELDPDGEGFQFCTKHSLDQKAELMGKESLSRSPTSLAMAEKVAKTGINFAKFFSFGNDEIRGVLQEKNVTAANPMAIGAAFTLCEKLETTGRPSCEGKTVGRIHWSEGLNREFTVEVR